MRAKPYQQSIGIIHLTLLWRRPISYRNQYTDLLCKSMDWSLYDISLRHERVNTFGKCSEKLIFLTLRYAQYSEYSEYTQANIPFLHSLFLLFSDVFRGCKKGKLDWNELKWGSLNKKTPEQWHRTLIWYCSHTCWF